MGAMIAIGVGSPYKAMVFGALLLKGMDKIVRLA
jgi:hypothetical protein|tara:strand:- start:779 stop:880 length:102 start_codon:yes stop_codon:yes gene_type:complete